MMELVRPIVNMMRIVLPTASAPMTALVLRRIQQSRQNLVTDAAGDNDSDWPTIRNNGKCKYNTMFR